jgi:hypothetical protein
MREVWRVGVNKVVMRDHKMRDHKDWLGRTALSD